MVSDWRELSIGDLAEVVGGGTPSTKEEANFKGDIPWITPKDLAGYPCRYIFRGERNISEQGLQNSSARLLPKGSVLLTTRAPVGYVAIAAVPVTTNQGFRSLVPRDGFLSEFIYYLLKAKTEYLRNHASGTTFGELSGTTLKSLRFCFPPFPEQQAIAHILGTLDDKIELNRRMNQTLEAMAQALFKSWFADFEPFRDEGMQCSPVGEMKIPMGWEVGALGQIAAIKMGQSPPGDTYNEIGEGMPFYQGIKDFGFRFPHHRVYCARPSRFADAYDILLSVRAPVGRLNVANEKCAIGRGLAALRSNEGHQSYLYYLLDNGKSRWETFNSEGTVFGCITRTNIADFKIIIPPVAIVERFQSVAGAIDDLIENNEQESHTLATIRDTFLPKLLSGEIRVKDAEKFTRRESHEYC